MVDFAKDFDPSGLRIEGMFENDRNAQSEQLFKDVIREAFGVKDVIIAHHLVYVIEEKRADGFIYTTVEEIPSADALIFDCDIGHKIFGGQWTANLQKLACEPVATRDRLYGELYYGRGK